jgi:hypothetical protein
VQVDQNFPSIRLSPADALCLTSLQGWSDQLTGIPTGGLGRVQISTMSVSKNLLVAGGFHGEMVCKVSTGGLLVDTFTELYSTRRRNGWRKKDRRVELGGLSRSFHPAPLPPPSNQHRDCGRAPEQDGLHCVCNVGIVHDVL